MKVIIVSIVVLLVAIAESLPEGPAGKLFRSGAPCESDADCTLKDEFCRNFRGDSRCVTDANFMIEFFEVGKPCSNDSDCPEACYTARDEPTCGPYLRGTK